MIDTTSVNYAMGKISEGWAKIAPSVHDIGEKYIRFVVTQAIVFGGLDILAAIAWVIFTAITFKKALKYESEPKLFCFMVYGILSIVCVAFLCNGIYDAILAYTKPEIYTIQTVINAAKSR
jgi:hypothetical protein